MVLGKLAINMQKAETRPLSLTPHKINSKWIKDCNIRSKTLKLLKEKVEKTLEDIGIMIF
jgi:hypothetical protein